MNKDKAGAQAPATIPQTMKTISAKITSTNKRERTITITKYEDGKPYARYKSIPLPKEEFHYYDNYATEGDINNFLKSDDYYPIPLKK